jgi:hypothetical protein
MNTDNTTNEFKLVGLADTNTVISTNNSNASSHIKDMSLSIKGLIKRLEYKYEVEGLGGNWPVAIVPSTGFFVAQSKNANIDLKAIFCPNTILCPSGSSDVLPYNRNYSYGVEDGTLFTTLRLKVSELDSNTDFIYSAPTGLSCVGCIPDVGPKVILPNTVLLDDNTKNSIIISGVASGVSPETRYSYRFKVLDATWPVEMYPLSGTIKGSSDMFTVPTQLVFCESAGDYETEMCGVDKEKRATISLELTPLAEGVETVSILSVNNKIISNDMLAECDDCVPIPDVKLMATPLTSTKTNRVSISGNITNLNPIRTYHYSLENIDSNWPLYVGARSGIISQGSTDYALDFIGEFCQAVSLCPSGAPGVIPYSAVASHTDGYTSSSFKLKVVDPAVTGTYYSNNIRVYCSDCSQGFMPIVVSSVVSDNPPC